MADTSIAFIGFGLIGGSIAKGLKRSDPNITVMAYMRTTEKLKRAKQEGIVDVILPGIGEELSSCDLIFLCTPVEYNAAYLEKLKPFLKPGALVTDVGSTKSDIHSHVIRLGMEEVFVGGHPMAGSEKTGYEHSSDHLLENAYYIITPTAKSRGTNIDRLVAVASAIGSIPIVLDYERHDTITAAISHLPHIVASSLVNLVRDSDMEDGLMNRLAAGGFKDITRIASSSPAMWQQICLTNGSNISSLLTDYIGVLTEFREQIDGRQAESLYEQFESARIYRDSFLGASSGPIKPVYGISVDIDDKTGALARIVTLLAERGISIKNIGITHNRESEDGVLKLEFYGEAALAEASGLLAAEGYAPRTRS